MACHAVAYRGVAWRRYIAWQTQKRPASRERSWCAYAYARVGVISPVRAKVAIFDSRVCAMCVRGVQPSIFVLVKNNGMLRRRREWVHATLLSAVRRREGGRGGEGER